MNWKMVFKLCLMMVCLCQTNLFAEQRTIYLYTSEVGPPAEQYLCDQLEIALKTPIAELRLQHLDEISQTQIDWIERKRIQYFLDITIIWQDYNNTPDGSIFPGYSLSRLASDYTQLESYQILMIDKDDKDFTILVRDPERHININFVDLIYYIKYIVELANIEEPTHKRNIHDWYTNTNKYQEVDESGTVWDVTEKEERYEVHPDLKPFLPFEWSYNQYSIEVTKVAYINTGGSVIRLTQDYEEIFNPTRKDRDGIYYPLVYSGHSLTGPPVRWDNGDIKPAVETRSMLLVDPSLYQKLDLMLQLDAGTDFLYHMIVRDFKVIYNKERDLLGEDREDPPYPPRRNE